MFRHSPSSHSHPPQLQQYDFLVREKIADGALISKWRKPGYDYLCSMLAIDTRGTNFGTTALCRVPRAQRAPTARDAPSNLTGCVSCATCDCKSGGALWWNSDLHGEEEEEGAEWAPVGGAAPASGGSGGGPPVLPAGLLPGVGGGGSRKRDAPDDDDEYGDDDDDGLDDDVRKRLAVLKDAGGG